MKFRIGDRVTIVASCFPDHVDHSGVITQRSRELVRKYGPWVVRLENGSEWGYAEHELAPWLVPEKHRALSAGRLAP